MTPKQKAVIEAARRKPVVIVEIEPRRALRAWDAKQNYDRKWAAEGAARVSLLLEAEQRRLIKEW